MRDNLPPAIVWLEQRRAEGQPQLGGPWGAAFKVSRMAETIRYIQAEAKEIRETTEYPAQ